MEHTSQKDVTPEELEKRLDEIFGGGDNETESSSDQSVLSNLDSVMLTLDWEISDETMSSFLSEVDSLKSALSQDRVLGGFLKILQSLGKYIQKRKGQTHPEAFTLLQSVYADLKKTVESEEFSSKQKKELLLKDIEKYNALKSKIAEQRSNKGHQPEGSSAAVDTSPDRQPAAETNGTEEREASQEYGSALEAQEVENTAAELQRQSDHSRASTDKTVLEAIDELKEVIQKEFRKLRKELGVQQSDK